MNMFAQMKFMHRKCLLLLVIFNFYMLNLSAKNEKDNIKISLITCSPGEDLYSIFGHTAIRVIDFATQTDVIFNYGTFDFYDPNFYVKFVKGKLDYFVSTDNPNDFFNSFKNIYNYSSLNVSWFPIIGDLDYKQDPSFQFQFQPIDQRWNLQNYYYTFEKFWLTLVLKLQL